MTPTKKPLNIIVLGIILAGMGGIFLRFAQVSASGPDEHQVFLPLVIGGNGNSEAVTTPPPVHVSAITGQGGRIDAFTFYIPYEANLLDDQFNIGQTSLNLTNVDIEFITSIAVQRDGIVIYYDQWEDGLERDITRPTQFSTQIWGDNDPSNGIPPGFASDVLDDQTVILLRNIIPIPRDPAELRFDGGDMFTAIGGPVATSITFWTAPPGPGILFTDAWELYPTNRWGTTYRIPIGENLNRPSNGSSSFEIVGLNVQAVENNTTVIIDLNGDGTPDNTVILNEGQQFNRIGTPNGIGPASTLVGATVQASAPVQVHLFAANPASTYEARGYTMLPFEQWTNDYLAPRTSDSDVWLYNPNSSPIVVNVETSLGPPNPITIQANTTVKYPAAGLSPATGMRFRSVNGELFYGVVALDATDDQDWGYALLPFNRLATQTLVGLGLGNNNNPPGPSTNPVATGFESRVYVTAANTTTIFVDYNNSNDSDTGPDASFTVSALQEVSIVDPTDYDMTRAFLYTTDGTPFIAVWGQDENANPRLPSIDAGTGVVPLPSLLVQKTFTNTACADTVTVDDIVQFNLQYFNNTVNPIRNVFVSDNLPAQVAYIPNSTRLNGLLLPDAATGTPFLLDNGGYNVGDIPSLADGFISFEAIVTDDSQGRIVNQAEARSGDLPLGSDRVFISIAAQPAPPILQVSQTLIDPAAGLAVSGQVVTFSLAITNIGSSTVTQLPLRDTFNETYLTFLSANPPPNLTASGVFTWTDLTNTLGDLAPGATVSTTVSFVVNQVPPTVPNTLVTATVLKARRSDNAFPLTCSANGQVRFFAPNPRIQVKKATNGFDADNPNNDRIPQIKPDDLVTWDYVVTNIGNVPLANVTLVDDQLALQGVSPTFKGGDTNSDNILDLDESWIYQATGIAEDLANSNWPATPCGVGGVKSPTYTNLATATGQYLQTTVTDDDPSHYCSPPPPPPPSGCKKDCDQKTPTPPPPPPPATPGIPGATPSLPIIFLPETGYRETSHPTDLIANLAPWVLVLLGIGVLNLRLKDWLKRKI
ncbi:MAG: hypothetical protein U0401_09460 [Anaerolineae bacterium]